MIPAHDDAAQGTTGGASADTPRATTPAEGALLGIDVGGTSIKARLVDTVGRELGHWRRPTPRDDTSGQATVASVAELVTTASGTAPVAGVGFVVPGVVDSAAGVCITSVNLGWRDLPIRDIVADRLGRPVAFGHDVRAGALAEARTGAAAGVRGLSVFLPLGTGLAAGYARDGQPFDLGPIAGEVGQVVLRRGAVAGFSVEEVASAGGIARRAVQSDAASVAALVRAGDESAIEIWREGVDVLADTIAWLTAVLGAEVIVLGGGLSAAGDLLVEPLERGIQGRIGPIPAPRLRVAVHGDAAAMIGAVMMAGDLIGVDPYVEAERRAAADAGTAAADAAAPGDSASGSSASGTPASGTSASGSSASGTPASDTPAAGPTSGGPR